MHTDIQPLASAITTSLSHYGRIYDHLLLINRDIGSVSETEMQSQIESLEELQRQARETDTIIFAGLNKEMATSCDLLPLLEKREGLVREIISLNNEVQKKAKDARSLLAHELVMLRRGQAALCGYKPQQEVFGKIVNNSS